MKKLTLFSIFLAAVVIILGAYTRLTDAGLGCPDWPGCYGNLTVPLSEEKVAQANAAYPERPVEAFKAWNEMIHTATLQERWGYVCWLSRLSPFDSAIKVRLLSCRFYFWGS